MKNALTVPATDVTSRKRSSEETENRGEPNCIRIEFTENGFNTRVSFDPEKIDPKKDRYAQMPDDEAFSFGSGPVPTQADCDALLAYVKALLMQHQNYEQMEAKEEKPKGKKSAPVGAKATEEEA